MEVERGLLDALNRKGSCSLKVAIESFKGLWKRRGLKGFSPRERFQPKDKRSVQAKARQSWKV